jgi:hypothetical protein
MHGTIEKLLESTPDRAAQDKGRGFISNLTAVVQRTSQPQRDNVQRRNRTLFDLPSHV